VKKILFVFLVFYYPVFELFSQNKTIRGRVITEFFETAPGTLILINDTIEVGKTDINGFFQIELFISVKKISIWSLGQETATIELVKDCDEIEVVMMLSGMYDFISLKKADRLRMKRFRKLPKLHRNAFEKGLFKTDKACYIQEFKPYCNKKRQGVFSD